MVTKRRYRCLLFLLLTSTLFNCADDEEADNTTASNTGADAPKSPAKAAGTDPLSGIENQEAVYHYSGVGKRDPFHSYLSDLKQLQSLPSTQRRTEDTERYELSQYRLTALITGTSQPKAMVEDPEQRGHVLRIGSRVGRNSGRVTRITAKGMTIVEDYRDATGKRVQVSINVDLPNTEVDLTTLDGGVQ